MHLEKTEKIIQSVTSWNRSTYAISMYPKFPKILTLEQAVMNKSLLYPIIHRVKMVLISDLVQFIEDYGRILPRDLS